VQGKAHVVSFERRTDFATLRAAFPAGSVDGVTLGASIAINGTCLTVTQQPGANELCFDLIVETLRATNLGTLQVGDAVNFERSARIGDEVGGHNVSGHIQTTATVLRLVDTPDNRKVVFHMPAHLMKYIFSKGFIAVDGCSLTVGEVTPDSFCVWLIPETLRVTVFGQRKEGDTVNIELDAQTVAIVDTVERILAAKAVQAA
jgi:riboflavin synthase